MYNIPLRLTDSMTPMYSKYIVYFDDNGILRKDTIENAYKKGIQYIIEDSVTVMTDGGAIMDITPRLSKGADGVPFTASLYNIYLSSNVMRMVTVSMFFDNGVHVDSIELPFFYDIEPDGFTVLVDGNRAAPIPVVKVGKTCKRIDVSFSAVPYSFIAQSVPFVIHGQIMSENEPNITYETTVTMDDGHEAHIDSLSGTLPLKVESGKAVKQSSKPGHRKIRVPLKKTTRQHLFCAYEYKRYCVQQNRGKIMPDVPIAKDAIKDLFERKKRIGKEPTLVDFVAKCKSLQYREDHKLRTIFERRLPTNSTKQRLSNSSKKMPHHVGRGADGELVYIKAYLPLCFSDTQECGEYVHMFRKALRSYVYIHIKRDNIASDFERDDFNVYMSVRKDCVLCVTLLKKGMTTNDAFNDNDAGYSTADNVSEVLSEMYESAESVTDDEYED